MLGIGWLAIYKGELITLLKVLVVDPNRLPAKTPGDGENPANPLWSLKAFTVPFEPAVQIWSNNSIVHASFKNWVRGFKPSGKKKNTPGQSRDMCSKQIIHNLLSERKLYKTHTKCTKTKLWFKNLHLPRIIHHFSARMPGWNLPKEIKLMICQSTLGMRTSHLAINQLEHGALEDHMPTNKRRNGYKKVAITFHKSKSILGVRVIILGLKRLWSFRSYGNVWDDRNCVHWTNEFTITFFDTQGEQFPWKNRRDLWRHIWRLIHEWWCSIMEYMHRIYYG